MRYNVSQCGTVLILCVISLVTTGASGSLLLGCKYQSNLCDVKGETCVEDGAFGRCIPNEVATGGVYQNEISLEQTEELGEVLKGLIENGKKWGDVTTQCVLLYFQLANRNDWRFEPQICVDTPREIYYSLLVLESALANFAAPVYDEADGGEQEVAIDDMQELPTIAQEEPIDVSTLNDRRTEPDESDEELADLIEQLLLNEKQQQAENDAVNADEVVQPYFREEQKRFDNPEQEPTLSDLGISESEADMLTEMSQDITNGRSPAILTRLSNDKIERFLKYLSYMNRERRDRLVENTFAGEVIPNDTIFNGGASELLKKDEEVLGAMNQGIGHKPINLVKGYYVNGKELNDDRFWDQVQSASNDALDEFREKAKENSNSDTQHSGVAEINAERMTDGPGSPMEQKLTASQARLSKQIMEDHRDENPNVEIHGSRLFLKFAHDIESNPQKAETVVNYFEDIFKLGRGSLGDVRVNGSEISFDLPQDLQLQGLTAPVFAAQAKKSSLELSNNADVDLLGIEIENLRGKRIDVLPTSVDDDSAILPALIVCGVVVGILIVVLGAYTIRARSHARDALSRMGGLDVEAHSSKDYEELCRQHMSDVPTKTEKLSGFIGAIAKRLGSQSEPQDQCVPRPGNGPHNTSHHSSTSSWSEEPTISSMDISTGHMVLKYLEDHLEKKDKLDEDWEELENYEADLTDVVEATKTENVWKNRDQNTVPYDHNRVVLTDASNQYQSDYINASYIHDDDVRNPSYIVTQGPTVDTVADFWQSCWESGAVVIVNLTKMNEDSEVKCHRYWPENGSEVYQFFEIHLVSEHIWCEDYLVRSFYLKNLKTGETRTVTQFHFLSWSDHAVPSSTKSLLEFRRKVNKSYRGRSSPIIVNCSDGAGRTGTYCLLDMVLNKIGKGEKSVKEIDIAATLEHLRDQRMKLVETKEQFEFVLTCVADEVQAILKALPQ